MAKLTDKQEQADWAKAAQKMREWHEELHSNITNDKFIELYVGSFTPQEPIKEDERLRK
ncbi:hypothetical protein N4227_13085 [Yersinia enterocolitica]|uniref:hypothetical protein n=1 Tax=Yersinia enterocolitica TaxID=630 RepID=UPI0021E7BB0E|nr:hypothetical protein [Yersinia enterocolitica]UYJ75334.1 hypothetical protein N4227_13085 [Yersinia enterocolitica]HDL7017672.1 hypothetical protein [Yersinia enterocolitica]